MNLYCEDLRKVRPYLECCSSCHDEIEEGYMDEEHSVHPNNRDVHLFHCCGCRNITDAEWDAMVTNEVERVNALTRSA